MSAWGIPFHFTRPWWLLLIPVIVLVWWFWRRSADPLRGWRRQMDPQLLSALTVGRNIGDHRMAYGLLTTWMVAVVAVAGPTWRLEPNPFSDDAAPLIILLKADNSMMVPDPAPSRMEHAHLKINDLASQRAGKPLGLIAYAGSAHLVMPATRDTDVVATMAREVSPAIMPVPGDRLDLALKEADRILAGDDTPGSVVVLADSVETPPDLLEEWDRRHPVQFLAINAPGSSQHQSLLETAKILDGSLQEMDVQGADLDAIIAQAARASRNQAGSQDGNWEEAGYWLIPVIAVLLLLSFRRQVSGEVSP